MITAELLRLLFLVQAFCIVVIYFMLDYLAYIWTRHKESKYLCEKDAKFIKEYLLIKREINKRWW